MDAATPRIKGTVLLSRLDFVEKRQGASGVDRVLARLKIDDRYVLGGLILPSSWYPFDLGDRLDHAIAVELGGGDAIFREMGVQSASYNLSDAHKVFVRDKDPQALLKSAAAIYRLYYDTGRRTYEATGDKRGVLRTVGGVVSAYDCMTVIGWHERAIEMCGGQRPRVTHPRCRARGDELCEYLCAWD